MTNCDNNLNMHIAPEVHALNSFQRFESCLFSLNCFEILVMFDLAELLEVLLALSASIDVFRISLSVERSVVL